MGEPDPGYPRRIPTEDTHGGYRAHNWTMAERTDEHARSTDARTALYAAFQTAHSCAVRPPYACYIVAVAKLVV
jgi:hypothetical protein